MKWGKGQRGHHSGSSFIKILLYCNSQRKPHPVSAKEIISLLPISHLAVTADSCCFQMLLLFVSTFHEFWATSQIALQLSFMVGESNSISPIIWELQGQQLSVETLHYYGKLYCITVEDWISRRNKAVVVQCFSTRINFLEWQSVEIHWKRCH